MSGMLRERRAAARAAVVRGASALLRSETTRSPPHSPQPRQNTDVAPTAAGEPAPAVERTESSSSFQHRPPRVLIANRGEIARRVIRTCRLHGVETLSVYTQPDALAPHAREATAAVCLGANPRGYTDAKKLLRVALEYGATAVHPGYGFLSENAEFCAAVEAAGIAWLGPTAQVCCACVFCGGGWRNACVMCV